MSRQGQYDHATLAAEQLVRELGITTIPVDPIAIAESRGIIVKAKPASSKGVSGMLLRVGDEFCIAYATHIDNEGFQRFGIAHELGHYFLPGHIDAVIRDGSVHESRAGFVSNDRYELEADHFAAGLLMPRSLFKQAMRTAGEGIVAIESLKRLCRTSLEATSIRYAQCTDDPMAIVISTGKQINYCFMSDALKAVEGLSWIRKREVLSRDTVTYQFNQDAGRVARAERDEGSSNLQDWFGGRREVEVREDVVGLGSYGKTLTVLHSPDLPDEEEKDEEDSLIESWTPRFRR